MATITQGNSDAQVQALKAALDDYETQHSGADAALYRRNNGSIRLRVIDRRFAGMTKSRRHADVWDFLAARVPEDTLADVSLVLAVAPAELHTSFANFEFDHPVPSRLGPS
jgi:stress-induced morphogen